jgi:tRNA dimethylallyltransferase
MAGTNKIIVILGPTSSGKSDLAVAIARKIGSKEWCKKLGVKGAEIISADSRQVYRGLNIGSGKITKSEMSGVPHHLLDVASPKRAFTVAQYQKLSKKAIENILVKGEIPIICGGTGFYINAVVYGLNLPAVPPQKKLRAKLEPLNNEKLFERLAAIDPKRAENIDRHNKRRLVRALEIALTTGKPVPVMDRRYEYDVMKIGISISQKKLRERINSRLDKRLRTGLVSEVSKLHKDGISWKRLDSLGLEYRYVSRYLRGLLSYEDMRAQLQKEIWQYSKRQMTWFKKDKDIIWLDDPRKAYAKLRDFLAP